VRIETRAVYYAMTAVLRFGSGLIAPAYVLLYVRTAGLGPLELVLVGTAVEGSYFLFNIPTGAFADTYGRKWAIVLGAATIGAGWVFQALVPVFAFILLAEVVRGLGWAFMNGATDAWIAGEVGDAALPTLFARASQVDRLGYLAGLGASVALATFGYVAPILAGAAAYGFVALGLVFVLREPAFQRPAERQSWHGLATTTRESGWLVRRSPFLLMLFAATAFTGAASEGFDRLSEPWVLTLIPPALAPVMALAAIDALKTVLGVATGEIARRSARAAMPVLGPILAVAEVFQIIATCVFALASGLPLAVVMLLSGSAVGSFTQPLYRAWLTSNIESRVRATVLSMHSLCNAGGQIGGGPVIGAIGSLFSIPVALITGSVFLVPNVVLYLRAGVAHRGAAIPAEMT
jgi:DHA3 family tetracycline resistance protein-like MFS transporter